jgi:hypothetical protein
MLAEEPFSICNPTIPILRKKGEKGVMDDIAITIRTCQFLASFAQNHGSSGSSSPSSRVPHTHKIDPS